MPGHERPRRRFTHPFDREIFRLALPAFGALIAEPLYVLADTAVVGHLGTPELAGLAVAGTLLVTAYSLFIFLAYGTTASVARLVGAGEPRRAAHEGVQGLWLALGIGVALSLGGLASAGPLVEAMGADGEVRAHALTYFRISLFGLPALMGTLAGTGYLRGLQDTKTPLLVTLATSLLNLILELVWIYGFGFGIGASALATVVAQVLGASIYGWFVARDVRRQGVSIKPEARSLFSLARVGLDLFIRTASLRLALVAATAIAARIGTTSLAAHQIAFEIWNFLALALDAVAIAGQTIIARMLGAGNAQGARAAGRRMIQWGLFGGLVLAVLILLVRPVLPHLFSDDSAVVDLTGFVLLFVALLQPLNGVVFVLDGLLIGAGDMRFLAWAMPGATALFLIGGVAVVAFEGGIGTLWAALGLFMFGRGAALLARFHSAAWQRVGASLHVASSEP